MLADESALRAVEAGASLRFQIDRVEDRLFVRLARHAPGAIVGPLEPAGCRYHQAALLSWVHCSPPLNVYLSIDNRGRVVNKKTDKIRRGRLIVCRPLGRLQAWQRPTIP